MSWRDRSNNHRRFRDRRGNAPCSPLPPLFAAAAGSPERTSITRCSLKGTVTPDRQETQVSPRNPEAGEDRALGPAISLSLENSLSGCKVDLHPTNPLAGRLPKPSNPSSPNSNSNEVSAAGGGAFRDPRQGTDSSAGPALSNRSHSWSTRSGRPWAEDAPPGSPPGGGSGGNEEEEEVVKVWVKGANDRREQVRFDPSSYLCVGRTDTLQPRHQLDLVPVDSDLRPEGWFMYHLSSDDVIRIDGTDERADSLLKRLGGTAAHAPGMAEDMNELTPAVDSHQWQDINGRKMQFFHLSHGDRGFEHAEKISEKHDEFLRPAIEGVLRKKSKGKLADSNFNFEITFGGLRSSPNAMVTHVQCAHFDHKTKVIEYYQKRDDKAAMLLFYPLTKAGMFLQVWVPSTFQPQIMFIGQHHLLMLPVDTIHGGGFKSGSFGVQNHRRHGYVYVGRPGVRIAREVQYSNLYIHPKKLITPNHACLANVPAETRSIVCNDLPYWFRTVESSPDELARGGRKRRQHEPAPDGARDTELTERARSIKKRRS